MSLTIVESPTTQRQRLLAPRGSAPCSGRYTCSVTAVRNSDFFNHANRSPDARRAGRFAAGIGLITIMVFAGGCEKPLFSPDEPRSQYDRFDAIRDQRAPTYIYDEFGERRPNIRQRLLTSE